MIIGLAYQADEVAWQYWHGERIVAACIGMAAQGMARDQTVRIDIGDALPGFEGYQGSGTRLSLTGSLGVAYDELTQK